MMVAISAGLYGFLGLIANVFNENGFTSMDMTFVRNAIPIIPLLVIILVADTKGFRIRLRDIWIFIAMGGLKAAADFGLFKAMSMMPISIATVLSLIAPAFVIILSFLIYKSPITKKKIVSVVMCLAGACFVTGVFTESSSIEGLGIAIAIGTAFVFGVYVMVSEVSVKRGYKPYTSLLYTMIFGALFLAPFADIKGLYYAMTTPTIYNAMIILGICLTLLPAALMMGAYRSLDSSAVSIISLLEVPSSALVGFFFLEQSLGWMSILGMVMILLSSVILQVDIGKIRDWKSTRKEAQDMLRNNGNKVFRKVSAFGGKLIIDIERNRTLEHVFALLGVVLLLTAGGTFTYCFCTGDEIETLAYVSAVAMVSGAMLFFSLSSNIASGEVSLTKAFLYLLRYVGGLELFMGAFVLRYDLPFGILSVAIGAFYLYCGYNLGSGNDGRRMLATALFITGVLAHISLTILQLDDKVSWFVAISNLIVTLMCLLFLLDREIRWTLFRDIAGLRRTAS